MITLYRGSRGKGKTLTMVSDALKYYLKGYRILTNIQTLKFGEKVNAQFILSLNRDSQLFNAVLVIDEIELFFDSRNFSRPENKTFSYFLQQIRKRNVEILCTCQYIDLVDKRLRQQLDNMAYPKYDEKTGYCGVHFYDITKLEDFEITNISPSLRVYDARRIFNLYDTSEMFL